VNLSKVEKKYMFEIELRYSIIMTLFRICKFSKILILYLKYSTHMKNLHRNVAIFYMKGI